MTRALLEQAIAALEGVLDAPVGVAAEFWSCAGGVYEAVECNNAINAIQAELAKPAHYDQTALELCDKCGWKTLIPGEGCLNCERSTQPAWHDAPNAPGLWMNSISGRVNVVIEETLSAWQDTGARWFGPLPEDTK